MKAHINVMPLISLDLRMLLVLYTSGVRVRDIIMGIYTAKTQ